MKIEEEETNAKLRKRKNKSVKSPFGGLIGY